MSNTMKGSFISRHDVEENWDKAINFKPSKSETILYEPDDKYNYTRRKIGDGESTVKQLPFEPFGNTFIKNTKNELEDLLNVPTEVRDGDIGIVIETDGGTEKSRTAYTAVYDTDGTLHWEAMNGNYTADNIYISDKIVTTTNVGELEKGTTLEANSSLQDIMSKILSNRYDVEIENPSITSFTVTNNGETDYEVGTTITPKYTINFNPGRYYYTDINDNNITLNATGVTVKTYTIRDNYNKTYKDYDDSSSTLDPITLGDTNLLFIAKVTYNDGVEAIDNTGKDTGQYITSGTTDSKTYKITPYRQIFAGGVKQTDTLNSSKIRTLKPQTTGLGTTYSDGRVNVDITSGTSITNSNKCIYFTANEGDDCLVIALPSSLSNNNTPNVWYYGLGWLELNNTFEQDNVSVYGANNTAATSYIVYKCNLPNPLTEQTQFKFYFN